MTEPSTSIVATKKLTGFELELAEYEPQIAAALPAHITPERFRRVVVTAINKNPDLYRADRRSLFTSCIQAAQDGVLPDGREAALVIFKMKNKQTGEWKEAVQYMPMIQGIIKRMRNSGDVAAVDSQIVHQKDTFMYRLGDDPKIEHTPALGDRGEPIAAYAIIKLTNGEILREVMGRQDIEKVRAVSRAKDNGPWVEWWSEMARKTVLRRCAKRAPVSSDLDEMLRRDDESLLDQSAQHVVDVSAPRPRRIQFEETGPSVEPFSIMTADGEDLRYEDAGHAAQAMADAILGASKIGTDAVDGLWESNGLLLSQLRERSHEKHAETLAKLYADTIERLRKPVQQTTEIKAEPQQQSPLPEAPPSPLRLKGKEREAAWAPFCAWLLAQLRALPKDQIGPFLKEHGKEYAFVVENRVADADAIAALMDERNA